MATQRQRLTERTAMPFAGSKVDRERGVIRDVLICGFESANGRDYPRSTFERDYRKYEGRPVNADHGREATIDRRLGWFENVKPGGDGRPRGDFHMLKSHPMSERVMEAAERNPRLYGFSHVADCRTNHKNGREVVESIEEVLSIDLVADPATTKGFFESRNPMKTTLRAVIESRFTKLKKPEVKREAVRILASEADAGMLDAPDAVTAPADDADPDDAVAAAFVQAMHSLIDSYDAGKVDGAGLVTKLKDLLKTHGKMSGKGDSGGGPGDGDDSTKDESKKKAAANSNGTTSISEAIEVCRKVGFKGFDADDLEAIANAPTERRESIARKLMGSVVVETPSARTRHDFKSEGKQSGGSGGNGGGTVKLAESSKDFKAFITEAG